MAKTLAQQIVEIMYDSCRNLRNIEDKIKVSSTFIFCYYDSIEFANLLYTDNLDSFFEDLLSRYNDVVEFIDLRKSLEDKEFKRAFDKTRQDCIKKFDSNGFYKAVFKKDEFALACVSVSEKVFRIKDFKEVMRKENFI